MTVPLRSQMLAALLLLFVGTVAGVAVAGEAGVAKPSTCKPLHLKSCWHDNKPLRTIKNSDVAACCAACDKEPKCTCWTLNHSEGSTCYLKPGTGISKHAGNCTSGGIVAPPPPPGPPPPPPPPAPKGAKNVLMILIDDIRPELSNYGSHVPTPNFEKFAKGALTLTNAYVQYSFCCPSRNSFLSGRRPSKTKVWTFADHFREAATGQNWTALPQWFKDHGYFTHGLGKLFHPNLPPNSDPKSWSDPSRISDGAGELPLLPTGGWASYSSSGSDAAEEDAELAHVLQQATCITGEKGGSYCELPEGVHGPDDKLGNNSVASLEMLAAYTKKSGSPFFLGVGFHKPHIPWTIPTRFFKPLGSIDSQTLPKHEHSPKNMPPMAWNKGLGLHALDNYADATRHPLHSFSNGTNVAFPHALTKAMRRGYFAAISYTDWLTGNVLDALEATGLADNTVVTIMGDHGYNLGELNLWCKMTVFESGVRVPFMIRAPGMTDAGLKSSSLAEAIDLMPTLIELSTGIKPPAYCDGNSLAPLVKNAKSVVKQGAYSEFVKCYSCCVSDAGTCDTTKRCAPGTPVVPGKGGHPAGAADLHDMANCFKVQRENIDFIGYSVRSTRWRYTEWLRFDGVKLHGDFSKMVARELYDHQGDDGGAHDWDAFENVNVAEDAANATVLKEMHALLVKGFPLPTCGLPPKPPC